MDTSQDHFKSSQERIQTALVATTRTVNALASEDLPFQRTVDPSLAGLLEQKTERLLHLSNSVLKSAGKATGHHAPSLDEADDVDIFYGPIVDVIDSLLEKADTCLDEYTGVIKRKDAPTTESGSMSKKPRSTTGPLDWSVRRANITKPQTTFERRPHNVDDGPWRPLLTEKPHAINPLEKSLSTFVDENDDTQFKHPYETEILHMKYPDSVYQTRDPTRYLPIESTAATWVDTYEGVLEMLEELKTAEEIAVDLEHHDFRTYNGLLSLMQISTRQKDWIVDTLKPWRHRLEVLNQVFANPAILKVFHGAFMDIIWLQRDLGLYIVGLFDTHHASDALGYPGKSLAYLLKRFVNFDADKKYQLADWRIRPLPDDMFYYARCDTHFLLYIYDMVKNELLARSDRSAPRKDLIGWVLEKSKETSLTRYSVTPYNPETGHGTRGWYNVLVKSPALYSREQFAVYRAVHKWRDDLARLTDESPFYVMSQNILTDIARIMPSDSGTLNGLLRNAHAARSSINTLFDVIQEARKKGANEPSMMDVIRADTTASVANRVFSDMSAKGSHGLDRAIASAKELRSEHSQLWGSIALSSVWDDENMDPKVSNDQGIAIPWVSLAPIAPADVGEDEIRQQTKGEGDILMIPLETTAKLAPQDPEFTLRAGRKRSIAEAENSGSSSGEDESESDSGSRSGTPLAADNDDGADESAAEKEEEYMNLDDGTPATGGLLSELKPTLSKSGMKRARRRERREKKETDAETGDADAARKVARRADKKAMRIAKRAAKKGAEQNARQVGKKAAKAVKKAAKKAAQQNGSEEAGTMNEQSNVPFDYSKAQSVLHAKGTDRGGNGPSNSNSAFDPYTAKTQAVQKGARNTNYEKAGKTATFKR